MASSSSSSSSSFVAKPGGTDESNRKLGELLQEQQEPFLLDVYLLERGYPSSTRRKGRKHHYSVTATSGCYPCSCPRNISDRNLKTFTTTTSGYGLKLNTPIRVVRNLSIPRNIHPRVPTTLRNINKLLSVSTSHRKTTKSHHFRACHDDWVGVDAVAPSELEEIIHHSQAAELGRVSSYITTTTTTTVFDPVPTEINIIKKKCLRLYLCPPQTRRITSVLPLLTIRKPRNFGI